MPLSRSTLTAGPVLLLLAAGCAPGLPGPSGARPTASRPDTVWSPPASLRPEEQRAPSRDLPAELESRRSSLTLEDVVALALDGSPDARASWAGARARAAAYGAARGPLFPTVQGDASATWVKTAASQGRSAVEQTIYEPSATFTYLLLDVGGRSGGMVTFFSAAGMAVVLPDPGAGPASTGR